jgi:hypothetical protein
VITLSREYILAPWLISIRAPPRADFGSPKRRASLALAGLHKCNFV